MKKQNEVRLKLVESFKKTIEYSTYLGANLPGVITGDPALQAMGPVVTAAVQDTFADFINRDLSNREANRVTNASILTIQKIEKELARGKTPRQDLFQQNRFKTIKVSMYRLLRLQY